MSYELVPHESLAGWFTLRKIAMSSATPSRSGSSNDHSRLAPSASPRWMTCTASVYAEKQDEDRIFRNVVQEVILLTPYLQSIPDELTPEEGRAMRWVRDVREKRVTPEKLSDAQKRDIWKSGGNVYSREGTRAHDFASDILRGNKTLEDIPEEFRVPVGHYVRECQALIEDGDTVIIEEQVPLFYGKGPDDKGTVDFAIIREDEIHIRDLKYGAGEFVDEKYNPQLSIYALSFIADLEDSGMYSFAPDTKVTIGIVQPRHHAGAATRVWEVMLCDLRDFGKVIEEAVDFIRAGKVQYVPSEKGCKWCPRAGWCEARMSAAADFLDNDDYTGLELLASLPDVPEGMKKKAFNALPAGDRNVHRLEDVERRYDWGTMGIVEDDMLVKLFLNRNAIEKFLDDNAEYLSRRVTGGEEIEGLKLVTGKQGDRMWKDEEAADKLLARRLSIEERSPRKLIGPAGVEKLVDLDDVKNARFKKAFETLIHRADGKPTVVHESDKRPAIRPEADFEGLEDEDLEDLDMG